MRWQWERIVDASHYLLDGQLPVVGEGAVEALEALAGQGLLHPSVQRVGDNRYRLGDAESSVEVVVRHPFVHSPDGAGLQMSSYLLKAAPPTAWSEIKRRLTSAEMVRETAPSGPAPKTINESLLDVVDPLCRDLLMELLQLEIEPPVVGYEVLGPKKCVCGELEIAYPGLKLGLCLEDEAELAPILEAEGWRLFSVEESAQLVEAARRACS